MGSKASNTRKREREEEEDFYLGRGAKLIRVSEAQDLKL